MLSRGALSGVMRQIVRFFCTSEALIELLLDSGASKRGLAGRPPVNFQDFMLILDPESTWHCNKSLRVFQGVKMNRKLVLRFN